MLKQIVHFGIVGAICTAIDFGVMIFLKEAAGLYYLYASGISFAVSVVINYFLSMKYVFRGKQGANRVKEFLIFAILCLIGLGFNQLIMWAAVDGMGISYVWSKAAATVLVMIYNFISKKVFLEYKKQEE